VSPGRAAELAAKTRETKPIEKLRGTHNSIEYSMPFSGGAAPVQDPYADWGHELVGRLLKSTLIATRPRAGVHRRVEAIRCELDNWVQCEYQRDELSDAAFFDLYYHEIPESDPLAAVPESWDRHIESLDEVKATLVRYYPECPPLRQLLKRKPIWRSRLLVPGTSPPTHT
jgi:hypothetical protein